MDDFSENLRRVLGLPLDASNDKVLSEIGYWTCLIHKLSVGGLIAQDKKYRPYNAHVQEMPRIGLDDPRD